MFLALALCTLACAPEAAVRTRLPVAGFLRDARAELRSDQHLTFEARIQWPATITRTSFVVEGLGADGQVLFARPVTASAPTPVGRHKRAVQARFDLELPSLDGVQELRVRLAH
jgi:hypothetical protein